MTQTIAQKIWHGAKKALKSIWFVGTGLIFPIALTVYRDKRKRLPKIKYDLKKSTLKLMWYFGVLYGVHPATAYLFPTAEDVLKENGFPAETVTKLAAGMEGKIHVRKDNFVGKVHAFFDIRPFGRILNGRWAEYTGDVQGYALDTRVLKTPVIYLRENNVQSGLKESYYWEKAVVEKETKGRYTRADILTPDEVYLRILCHEIRHHSEENSVISTPFAREADADFYAGKVMADIFKNAAFMDLYLLSKSEMEPPLYDNVLYLDALAQGKTPPSPTDIMAANEEAMPVIRRLGEQKWDIMLRKCDDNNCADQIPNTLSDLAKMRVEFAQRAWDAKYRLVPQNDTIPASNKPALKIKPSS